MPNPSKEYRGHPWSAWDSMNLLRGNTWRRPRVSRHLRPPGAPPPPRRQAPEALSAPLGAEQRQWPRAACSGAGVGKYRQQKLPRA